MCCTRLAGNTGLKNYAKIAICAASHNFVELYFRNYGTYLQSEKNLLSSSISSRRPTIGSMMNFGPLTAKIGSDVWGTPANFNEFHVLASLLQRCHSVEANQSLHDFWPSPELVHYLYIFGGCCPLTEFCHVQISLCVPSLALLHGTPAAGVSRNLRRSQKMELQYLRRRHHLYSAGRPSRFASAHILVSTVVLKLEDF